MSKRAFFLASALLAGAIVSGCGDKSDSGAGKSRVITSTIAPGAQPSERQLTELKSAVLRYWEEKGRPPKSLEDVVAGGYLKAIPVPPPGKRYAFDEQTGKVTLVPQ